MAVPHSLPVALLEDEWSISCFAALPSEKYLQRIWKQRFTHRLTYGTTWWWLISFLLYGFIPGTYTTSPYILDMGLYGPDWKLGCCVNLVLASVHPGTQTLFTFRHHRLRPASRFKKNRKTLTFEDMTGTSPKPELYRIRFTEIQEVCDSKYNTPSSESCRIRLCLNHLRWCKCVQYYCHRVSSQLQLTNTSISYIPWEGCHNESPVHSTKSVDHTISKPKNYNQCAIYQQHIYICKWRCNTSHNNRKRP